MMRFLFPVLCAALAGISFAGKGNILLLGSRDSKDFNEKKMRLVAGIGLSVLAVFSLASTLLQFPVVVIYIVCTVLCFTLMLLCNTICAENKDVPLRERTAGMVFVAVLLAAVFCTASFNTGAGPTIRLTDTEISVKSSAGITKSIPYTSVLDTEYIPKAEPGTRLKGVEGPRAIEGTFRNEAYKDYSLYVYTASDSWILLRTAEGTFVLSDRSEDATRALYAKLHERTLKP